MIPSYYPNNTRFLIAVDCIILGFRNKELHLLLTRRPVEPMKHEWSLMGGFMEENESLNMAAEKILYRYTGQKDIYMEQVGAYGAVDRDTGGRVISVAFYALVPMEQFDTSLAREYDARWMNINELPHLVFDHNQMVQDALTLLRYKVSTEPVIFNFFEERFTLPALQDLYEAIFQMPMDKRNFRKKLTTMNLLDRLEDKDKKSSKRGAYFYLFNPDKYSEFIRTGKRFSL
ncbi:MAG: NUDIX domain-containing protein [Proteiniphilum sp.]|jgi:ADP-ribose pyrophosphatase YjhB (NUDIX family)|nr:NUDIX domain-containing protein [Proteiniphilum sp.]MDD4158960.1 NUDIX domain-containing protein [Proteiniphilum sp.]MDD4799842.1 NUDIX domain-containing protein [Proteiniphilum sp.]